MKHCKYAFLFTFYSYAGTITGIDDLNSVCWPNSKWRSLRVDWDEKTNNEQRDRVSPWEIELSSSSNNNNSSLKNKRLRPTLPSDSGKNMFTWTVHNTYMYICKETPKKYQGCLGK